MPWNAFGMKVHVSQNERISDTMPEAFMYSIGWSSIESFWKFCHDLWLDQDGAALAFRTFARGFEENVSLQKTSQEPTLVGVNESVCRCSSAHSPSRSIAPTAPSRVCPPCCRTWRASWGGRRSQWSQYRVLWGWPAPMAVNSAVVSPVTVAIR